MDLLHEDNPEMIAAIVEYQNFLSGSDMVGSSILTPSKVQDNFENVGNALNTLIAYPDIFVDLMVPTESKFNLYFFQRIILRVFARFKQSYVCATRAASKSFLAFLSRYLSCMELPNQNTFVCMEIKQQATKVAREKVEGDLWQKFPLLKNEMIKIPQPGKAPASPFKGGNDYAQYNFSNHSVFDVVSVDSARGLRRTSGLIEEVIEQDQTKINEKIIPLLNVSRRTSLGEILPNEPHAAKIYVTTAGYQGTFAYQKYIETLCLTAIDPDKYMCLSLTYQIPLMHGLLDKEQLRDVLVSPSFEQDSFDREYNSKWSGSIKGAAFSYKTMQKARRIKRAELKAREVDPTKEFYVVCADMAKDGSANTAVVIDRVTIGETHFTYQTVNATKIDYNDYSKVANELKKLVIAYKARLLIYDANGIGAAIRDWLNKPTNDALTGEMLPGYGIINPPTSAEKDLIRYPSKDTICYEIKAGSQASDINYLFFGRLNSGAIKLLIPFRDALDNYKKIKSFVLATNKKQKRYLRPYQVTDQIQEELLNLDVVEIVDTGRPALKVSRRNANIQKDFFSALSYCVWGVHQYIELKYYKQHSKTRLTKAAALSKIQSRSTYQNNVSGGHERLKRSLSKKRRGR